MSSFESNNINDMDNDNKEVMGNAEIEHNEIQDPEDINSEIQDAEVLSNEMQDSEIENNEMQDIEVINNEIQDTEVVNDEIQDDEAEMIEMEEEAIIAEQNDQRQTRKKGMSPVFTGILGAIIGSSTMLGGYLFVSSNNIGNINNVAVTVNSVSQDEITAMVQEAKKSVVGVTSFQTSIDDVLGNLLGETEEQSSSQTVGSGSGIIYKKEGGKAFVVTNQHVIDGAQQLEVTLENGTSLEARLIGADPWMDLAVLEIDGSKVQQVATLGDSDSIITGQAVIAIGNPLGFLAGSVTQGIISSQERLIPVDVNGDGVSDWEAQVIQTDAAINPGNSGGALLNANGEVIGINSSKIAGDAIEGLGFAIPVNAAIPILEQLEENGEVKRAQMGVQLVELSQVPSENRVATLSLSEDVANGLVVISVNKGSAAHAAGLQMYDVIVDIDGRTMGSMLNLRRYLFEEREIGDTISITYYRNGQSSTTSLTLESTQS